MTCGVQFGFATPHNNATGFAEGKIFWGAAGLNKNLWLVFSLPLLRIHRFGCFRWRNSQIQSRMIEVWLGLVKVLIESRQLNL